MNKIKNRIYEIMEGAVPGDKTHRVFEIFIVTLITANVIAVMLETEKAIHLRHSGTLRTFDIVSRDLSDRIELDEAQFTALQAVIENDIVVVRGGAGTGKTILARELARKEAAAGKSVLVLTYTEALGMELAKRLESVKERT